MSSRLFGTTTDYARFSGTLPVTAAPLTMLAAAQASSFPGAVQCPLSIASTGTDHFRLGLNANTGTGMFGAHTSAGSQANSTNTATVNVPFIVIGREVSSTSRSCVMNGDIANMGTQTTSRVPASLSRFTIGKRDSSDNTNPMIGVVFYAAIWNVALSDEECIALGLYGAPPTLIRPGALMSYWPNLGRSNGTTIVDVLGRCPLTITGGSDSLIAMRRWMPDIGETGPPSPAQATNSAAAGSARFTATAVSFVPPVSGSVLLEDGVLELLLESGDALLLEDSGIAISASASAQLAQTTIAASRKNSTSAAAGRLVLTSVAASQKRAAGTTAARLAQGATAPSSKKAFVAVALEASRTSATGTRGTIAKASAATGAARAWAKATPAAQASASLAVAVARVSASAPATTGRQSAANGRHAQSAAAAVAIVSGTALLLEDSNELLLESGEPLLLETAVAAPSGLAVGAHTQTATAPARKGSLSISIARHERTVVAAPSLKKAASIASGRHASAAVSGASRKQAAAIALAKATSSAVTGAVSKATASAAQGAARLWAQGTSTSVQTTSSAAAGGQQATATVTDSTGRSTLAAGAIRSAAGAIDTTSRRASAVAASTGKAQAGPSVAKHVSAASSGHLRAKAAVISTTTRSTALARGSAKSSVDQPTFLTSRGTLRQSAAAPSLISAKQSTAIAGAKATATATDTTGRLTTGVAASTGKAQAAPSVARHVSAASSCIVRCKAAVTSGVTVRSTALARGSARLDAAQFTFLSTRGSIRQSAIATTLTVARRSTTTAAAVTSSIAIDSTGRRSATAIAAAFGKAVAPQGNTRQSAASGRVRSGATVTSGATVRSTALARGSARTSSTQATFLTSRATVRQSAVATNLTSARQASVIAAASTNAFVTDTTIRTAPAVAGVKSNATALQANTRQSTAIGRVRLVATVISGTSVRSTALARGSARTHAAQFQFLGAKATGAQSAVAAAIAQKIATAGAAHRARATVASGQAKRTSPTLFVIAGTDVTVSPGQSTRQGIGKGAAVSHPNAGVTSGAATRRGSSLASQRFTAIGIQTPPQVIELRGRRDSTVLRGKYGNGSLRGQTAAKALRGRR